MDYLEFFTVEGRMSKRPILPSEIPARKEYVLPDKVVEAVNDCVLKAFVEDEYSYSVPVHKHLLASSIFPEFPKVEGGWIPLIVERYRESGWDVKFLEDVDVFVFELPSTKRQKKY